MLKVFRTESPLFIQIDIFKFSGKLIFPTIKDTGGRNDLRYVGKASTTQRFTTFSTVAPYLFVRVQY